MSNDYQRAADALECPQRRLDTLLVSRVGIAKRHVRRHGFMPTGAEFADQRGPAGAVMPVSVKQAEGGHPARAA